MPLPCPAFSASISISQIRSELGTSNGSLRYLSSLVGFSTPDAMSEFYCYSNVTYNYFGNYYINTCGANYNIYRRSDNGVFYYLNGTYILAEGQWFAFMFEDPPLYLWASYYISGSSIEYTGDYYSTCGPY